METIFKLALVSIVISVSYDNMAALAFFICVVIIAEFNSMKNFIIDFFVPLDEDEDDDNGGWL